MKHLSGPALGLAATLALASQALAAPTLPAVGTPSLGGLPAAPVSVPWSQLPASPATLPSGGVTGAVSANATAGGNVAGHSANASASSNEAVAATTCGKVAAVSANALTLTLPNGAKKTFAIDASGFGKALPRPGDRLAVNTDAQGRVVSIAHADQSVRATVAGLGKDTLMLRLPNGRTVSLNVSSRLAARLKLKDGSSVTLSTHDGGRTSVISTK